VSSVQELAERDPGWQRSVDRLLAEAQRERAGFRQWGIGHGDTAPALWLEDEDQARATVKQARREGSKAELVYREVGPLQVEPRPVPERPRARVTDLFEFAAYVEAEGNIWDATRVYGPEMAPGGEFGALWAKAVALVAEGGSVAAEKAVVAVGEFLDEVTEGRTEIWSPRGTVPAMVRCRSCGTLTEMDDPVATVTVVTLDDQPAGWHCRDCSEGRRSS
jgi:hypothetical protein